MNPYDLKECRLFNFVLSPSSTLPSPITPLSVSSISVCRECLFFSFSLSTRLLSAIGREHSSFMDAAQREKMREREARESGLMFIRDRLIEMISVRLLFPTSPLPFYLCIREVVQAICHAIGNTDSI